MESLLGNFEHLLKSIGSANLVYTIIVCIDLIGMMILLSAEICCALCREIALGGKRWAVFTAFVTVFLSTGLSALEYKYKGLHFDSVFAVTSFNLALTLIMAFKVAILFSEKSIAEQLEKRDKEKEKKIIEDVTLKTNIKKYFENMPSAEKEQPNNFAPNYTQNYASNYAPQPAPQRPYYTQPQPNVYAQPQPSYEQPVYDTRRTETVNVNRPTGYYARRNDLNYGYIQSVIDKLKMYNLTYEDQKTVEEAEYLLYSAKGRDLSVEERRRLTDGIMNLVRQTGKYASGETNY